MFLNDNEIFKMANIANVNFPPNFGNPLTAVERAQRSVFGKKCC